MVFFQVGINCQRQRPCTPREKCVDICECPGYRCIRKSINSTFSFLFEDNRFKLVAFQKAAPDTKII